MFYLRKINIVNVRKESFEKTKSLVFTRRRMDLFFFFFLLLLFPFLIDVIRSDLFFFFFKQSSTKLESRVTSVASRSISISRRVHSCGTVTHSLYTLLVNRPSFNDFANKL